MLEVNQLKRAYGNFLAVDGVSFAIARGEVVGLLGHNGAGKTTIMKMLSGYLEPSGGSIHFLSQPLAENLKSLQAQIGYLPESLPVYPELSVADYLDYAAELKGLRGEEKQREIRRAIQATDIGDKLLNPIATLSRGYKQRVGVAQAILGKPSLLILDEPTNGLDPSQTLQMRELIRSLAKEATVILSTHIMQEVEAVCDRVLMVKRGHLVIDARLQDLRQGRQLLLATSSLFAEVEASVRQLSGVEALTLQAENADGQSWRVQLSEEADIRTLSAALARTLVNANVDLFELRSEKRDLEALFREAHEEGEQRHAA